MGFQELLDGHIPHDLKRGQAKSMPVARECRGLFPINRAFTSEPPCEAVVLALASGIG